MKVPQGLQPLVEDGVVDAVIRQLQSGKEAEVYVVACGEEIRCAKVYKSSEHRSFKKVAEYREGRKSRGSRNTRATAKRGRHGRKLKEEGNCSPGGSAGYSVSRLRQSTAFPCRAMVMATKGL